MNKKIKREHTSPSQITMSTNNTSSNRLSAAAEELIKAASVEVDSLTQQQLSSNLESLKNSFTDLKNEISILKNTTIEHDKNRTLEWAYTNADSVNFMHYINGRGSSEHDSSWTIKEIIFSFRTGAGRYFNTNDYYCKRYEAISDENKKAFRDKISHTIHQLTGKKPRLTKDDTNGNFAIYYD